MRGLEVGREAVVQFGVVGVGAGGREAGDGLELGEVDGCGCGEEEEEGEGG